MLIFVESYCDKGCRKERRVKETHARYVGQSEEPDQSNTLCCVELPVIIEQHSSGDSSEPFCVVVGESWL